MDNTRITLIRALIESQGRISLDELVERFKDVSSMTLRRDLMRLEEEGEVLRVRGGAVSVRELSKKTEDFISQRAAVRIAEKKLIAEKAASIAEPGCSLFIDSGSTSLFLVKQLPDINYTVITNGINVALELARKSMPSITVLGGMLSRNNCATSGVPAMQLLSEISIETAFMCATAFTAGGGFTCASASESEIKKAVMKKSKRKIMLMDSSKVGKVMPYTFAAFEDIDVLVSDGNLPQDVRDAAFDLGISIL